jgi:hypothetical protein
MSLYGQVSINATDDVSGRRFFFQICPYNIRIIIAADIDSVASPHAILYLIISQNYYFVK